MGLGSDDVLFWSVFQSRKLKQPIAGFALQPAKIRVEYSLILIFEVAMNKLSAYKFLTELVEKYPSDAVPMLQDIIVDYLLFPHGDGEHVDFSFKVVGRRIFG